MREIKDTKHAEVRIGYDGRVHKHYRGPLAKERFENEVRVLKCLEARSCLFVLRLLEARPEELYIITTAWTPRFSPNQMRDFPEVDCSWWIESVGR